MASSRLARRSWRCLGWLLAGFALCQVAVAVAIDGWLPGVRDPEYAAKLERLRARRAEAPGRPLVVLLGSSRVALGLDAGRLSRADCPGRPLVFNFAVMGGGPLMQLVNLRRLLAEGIRPELVYAEVTPPMLAECEGRVLEERLLNGARLRGPEAWYLSRYYHQAYRLLYGWGLGRLLPGTRHQAEIHDCLGCAAHREGAPPTSRERLDGHGWHPGLDRVTEEYRQDHTRAALDAYGDWCAAPAGAAEAVRALDALLGLCRRKRIAAALLLMPEGGPFRALYSPQARQSLDAVLGRLGERWGVPVVDTRTWVEDAGFSDGHHLLADGARRFTERFGREVLAPALAAPRGGEYHAARWGSARERKETGR